MEEQLEVLSHGAVQILPEGNLKEKLALGRPLRVKLGMDPTRPDIHIGHAVVLRKLRQFQDFGHEVILIIGDFTAMIGDPTGKKSTRPALTREEIAANAQTYAEQVGLILDLKKTRIVYNSEWLNPLTLADTIRLAGRMTVAQMLVREDFRDRYTKGEAIALHELMYPLVQAYDSVALEADIELGGTDQTFNLLAGREIQESYGLLPQTIMTFPILEGLDGVQKMSKSLDNYIGLTETPTQQFGKVMSISDELMTRYWELAADVSPARRREILTGLTDDSFHPMEAKKQLASNIVAQYHGEAAGQAAREEFEKLFGKKKSGGDLPEDATHMQLDEPVKLLELIVKLGFAGSNSEARRLVEAGSVKRNGEAIKDTHFLMTPDHLPCVLQVGKKRFASLTGSA